jgi:predicted LPLAT superfamily acyltransferase
MRVGSATVLKQGFHACGLPLTHLSRAEHGSGTKTRLGLGVVAPLHRRVEDAVLRERVQIPISGSLAYLRTLGDRLAANQCVSIFGEHTGRQSVTVTVLGMEHRYALGAPSLAWRENAGLVTAYALREGPFRYRVVIEEEMAVDRDVSRRCFAEQAVQAFAGRLERCILRHPADWHGWFYLVASQRGDSFAGRES